MMAKDLCWLVLDSCRHTMAQAVQSFSVCLLWMVTKSASLGLWLSHRRPARISRHSQRRSRSECLAIQIDLFHASILTTEADNFV